MSLPKPAPIFGADVDLDVRQPFKVHALYVPDGTRHVLEFLGYTDPGSGPIFRFSASGAGEAAQIHAAADLIMSTTVRDDAPPVEAELMDDDEEDGDAPPEVELSTEQAPAPVTNTLAYTPASLNSMSSFDRFRALMNSRDWRVASDVLVQMAEWIAQNAGMGTLARPTQSPAR